MRELNCVFVLTPEKTDRKILAQTTIKPKNQTAMLNCPAGVFRIYLRLGHGLGQSVDPDFDPYVSRTKNAEKHRISYEIRCFMVAEAGLEPATSGL